MTALPARLLASLASAVPLTDEQLDIIDCPNARRAREAAERVNWEAGMAMRDGEMQDIVHGRDNVMWQPIETAPKDGKPILGWCNHLADPYFADDSKRTLTVYASHCEGWSHVDDGANIIQWGGEDSDYDEYRNISIHISAFWYRYGSCFEEVANPTHWMPLPEPPHD